MSDFNQWQFDNDEYLAAAMEWLRVILTYHIERQLEEPPANRIARSDVEMAAEKLTAAE